VSLRSKSELGGALMEENQRKLWFCTSWAKRTTLLVRATTNAFFSVKNPPSCLGKRMVVHSDDVKGVVNDELNH